MSYLSAAAGTGGHVYPGLAVGEALVAGVPRHDVHFVGGDRLEARVCPAEGFPFFAVPLRGLERRLTGRNLAIPRVVRLAAATIGEEMAARGVGAVLGMGGYVTLPAAWAARRRFLLLFVAEQNAHAGLANRVTSRWAVEAFASFPGTRAVCATAAGWGTPSAVPRRRLTGRDSARRRWHAVRTVSRVSPCWGWWVAASGR